MKMNEFECEMNPTLSHVISFPRLLFNIHDREGKVTWRNIITWHADIVISLETQIRLSGPSSQSLQLRLRPDKAETSVTWCVLTMTTDAATPGPLTQASVEKLQIDSLKLCNRMNYFKSKWDCTHHDFHLRSMMTYWEHFSSLHLSHSRYSSLFQVLSKFSHSMDCAAQIEQLV